MSFSKNRRFIFTLTIVVSLCQLVFAQSVLFVAGNSSALNSSDQKIIAMIESNGYSIITADDDAVTLSDADGMDGVVVSSTCHSNTIGNTFQDISIPFITWEAWLYDDMGMANNFGKEDNETNLMVLSGTPLGAGLSGEVSVVTAPESFHWASPQGEAYWSAEIDLDHNKCSIFGYEQGALMTGGVASGKRGGLFLSDNTATLLTDAGEALVMAMINWAFPPAAPVIAAFSETTYSAQEWDYYPQGGQDPYDGLISLSVLLNEPAEHDITIPIQFIPQTATADDIESQITEIFIPTGAMEATVNGTVTGDWFIEDPETCIYELQSTGNVTVGTNNQCVVTIVDNDLESELGRVSFTGGNTIEVTESDGVISVPCGMMGKSYLPVCLTVETAGTATEGVDYIIETPQVCFDATELYGYNKDISIEILNDEIVEPLETIIITMTDITGGIVEETVVCTISVINDDIGGNNVLFIAGSTNLSDADRALITRMENLNCTVTITSDQESTASDAENKDLVFISSTVKSTNVNTKFRNVPVPVMTSEAWLYDDLGMTNTYDYLQGQDRLTIQNPSHPLAAGLSGTVLVTTAGEKMYYGIPNENASFVASIVSDTAKGAIFSYDQGAVMPGMTAPAKRIGFFTGDNTALNLTQEGWRLFDSAVLWAIGTGSEVSDIEVLYIERTPKYDRYSVAYKTETITDTEEFIESTYRRATGLEYGQDANTKRNPEQGEQVYFIAHVKNRGNAPVSNIPYRWILDGVEIESGIYSETAAPGENIQISIPWSWDQSRHTIEIRIDAQNDATPSNNSLIDYTDAHAFALLIWESYDRQWTERTVRYPSSKTKYFSEWLQNAAKTMNNLLDQAGSQERIRIDYLGIVPDGTPGFSEYEKLSYDGYWPAEDGVYDTLAPIPHDPDVRDHPEYDADLDVEFGLIHEWGHQIGLIDIYQLNLESNQNEVNGESYRSISGVMNTHEIHFFSIFSINALNSWQGKRRGYYGQYLYNIPAQNNLVFYDRHANPLTDAHISVYQKMVTSTGVRIPNSAKFSGTTDSLGTFALPNVPITPSKAPVSFIGDELHSNPFGYVDVIGRNGTFLIKIEYNGAVDYQWLDITSFNKAYFDGKTEEATYQILTDFVDPVYFSYNEDLTEKDMLYWSVSASDNAYSTIDKDYDHVLTESASIHINTQSGFEVKSEVLISGSAVEQDSLLCQLYSVNNNLGFQNQTPWIVITCEGGEYWFKSPTTILNESRNNWLDIAIPLTGNADWSRTVVGNPDLNSIRSISVHADTWEYSFELWIDGLMIVQ